MNFLKRIFLFLVTLCSIMVTVAQTDTAARLNTASGNTVRKDSPQPATPIQRSADTPAINRQDTVQMADSTVSDTLQQGIQPVTRIDTSTYRRYHTHAYLPMSSEPVFMISDFREQRTLDDLFYLLLGVVFLLAFIKSVFPKYFKNMFVLFLQTSLRQKQTRDQLLQDNMGSVFSNLLFVVSTSIYGALIIRNKEWLDYPFWHIIFFGAGLLTVVYLGKFLFLQFSGWVFNSREAAVNYTFTVFLVNKVLGVVLVPFLFLVAFTTPPISEIAFTVSVGLFVILLLYRYIISFATIRNTLKVNALHFFLYLCAVEVLPLLVLYKLLANYISGRF